jgi:hypothetical protein
MQNIAGRRYLVRKYKPGSLVGCRPLVVTGDKSWRECPLLVDCDVWKVKFTGGSSEGTSF